MPVISEKIAHPSAYHLRLYKEGAFWVAYEQSAFFIAQLKGYKPNKKHIKVVGNFVVSVGFPKADALIDELEKANLMNVCNRESNFVEIVLNQSIDAAHFENWKTTLEEKSQKKEPNPVADIKAMVKAFPLAHKTPMEAFMFLKQLQESF